MKIIGISGSPRHNMNTAILIQKVLEGAKSKNADTKLFYINDYNINGCKACSACKKTRKCVQKDDMQILYNAINESKGLVLGSPIYFDQVSAQTKIFIDRLYSYLGPNLEKYYPKNVKSVLILTWEASNSKMYDDVAIWLEKRLSSYHGIETIETFKVSNSKNLPVARREDLLKKAFNTGIRLAENLAALL